MGRLGRFSLILGALLLVAACGPDGPGEADIVAAVKVYAGQAQQQAEQTMKAVKEAQDNVMQETDPRVAATVNALQTTAATIVSATAIRVASKAQNADGSCVAKVELVGTAGTRTAIVKLTKTGAGWNVVDFHT